MSDKKKDCRDVFVSFAGEDVLMGFSHRDAKGPVTHVSLPVSVARGLAKTLAALLACAMLVGCGAADPDFGSPSCDAPRDAVYEPTVTTLDVGCPTVSQSVKVVGGEPRFGGGSTTTLSSDKCYTDTVLGQDWMYLEWSSDWSVGFGTATVGACHYNVQLVKQ